MSDSSTKDKTATFNGGRALQATACLVIVVAGLKQAGSLLVPILIAALISIACMPAIKRLARVGIPTGVAILLIVLGVMIALSGLTGVVSGSVAEFTRGLEGYQTQLVDKWNSWVDAAGKKGLNLSAFALEVDSESIDGAVNEAEDPVDLLSMIDAESMLRLIADSTGSLLGALSNVVVILMIMAFMLLESAGMPAKLKRAMRGQDEGLSEFSRVTNQVYDYLFIKTWISLLTGLIVAGFTMAFGVDFPALWGLVAFLFNFIPNIGSILAAIPAVLLALIQFGLAQASFVALAYVATNLIIGNVVEPKVMGKRLGLSPLVVILSLIFWSWVWGPIGMILSLPLTMVLKILLENSEDYRFVAILLGPSDGIDPPRGSK